jgi:hypothetical protein
MSLFNLVLDKLPALEPVEGARGGGGESSIEKSLEPTISREDGRQRGFRELVDSESCEIGGGGRTGTLEVSVVLPNQKWAVSGRTGFKGGCINNGGDMGSFHDGELPTG